MTQDATFAKSDQPAIPAQAAPSVEGAAIDTGATARRPAGSLPGAILQLAGARGIVIAISFVTGPILGRLFPPHAYGALGVLSTVLAILAASASLSYVSAIPVAATPSERRDLVVLCGLIGILATAAVSVCVFLGADLLAYYFHEPDVAKYALFLPLMFIANAIRQLLDTTLSCQRRFGVVGVRNVLEIVVTRIVQFGACLVGLIGSPVALIVGALSGTFLSALPAGMLSAGEVFRTAEQPFRLRALRDTAIKHRKFPLIHLWSLTINAVTFGLPTILLGLRFSMDVVGSYGMAYAMVTMPIQLFTAAANQVFYIEAGERVAMGKSASAAAEQLVRVMAALTSFPLMVVLVLGPLVFEVFLGPRWHEAGVYAQILVPWMMLMAISSPLSVVYAVLSRQGEGFIWNIALLAARFSALYFGGLFFGPRTTLGVFVAVSAVIVVWLIFRPLFLFGVSRRRAAAAIARSYVEPLLLLAPAGIIYWHFGARILALAALAVACAGYSVVLYRHHPAIVRPVLSPLVDLWTRAGRAVRREA